MFCNPEGRKYKHKRVLGRGSYGTAILCEDPSDVEALFVVKKVRLARQSPKERYASIQVNPLCCSAPAGTRRLMLFTVTPGSGGWIAAACSL